MEIKSKATEGVRYLVVMKMIVVKDIVGSRFKDPDLGMGISGMWQSVISEFVIESAHL